MPKMVYYSKKYIEKANTAAIQANEVKAAAQKAAAQKGAAPKKGSTGEFTAVKASPRRVTKAGPVLMISCLVVAILCVLLVPMLVGGAEPAEPAAAQSGIAPGGQSAKAYDSPRAAMAELGIDAVLPENLPEDCLLTSCNVLDGSILEIGISYGKGGMLFRVAAGSDDLSFADYEQYPYTLTEEVDGITRGYAGVSEKKMNLAVWVNGDNSYALVAENGLDADQMKAIAESIV